MKVPPHGDYNKDSQDVDSLVVTETSLNFPALNRSQKIIDENRNVIRPDLSSALQSTDNTDNNANALSNITLNNFK